MRHRFLGRSGLQVPVLTYGNWLTHGESIDQDLSSRCVAAALDAGITAFDTADTYADGAAEETLGVALRGARRQSLVLSTKVFFPTGPDPRGKNDMGLSRKHVSESIDASLRRLGTDYVDVYYAHRYDLFTPLEETMQAFADIVRSGKALYIGVSEWTDEQLRAGHALARELGFSLIANQSQYSLLWRVTEERVIPTAQELGISQVVWSPLAQGVLTGKYLPGQPVPSDSRAGDTAGGGARMIEQWMRDDVLEAVQRIRPIADDLSLSVAQLALAWTLANDGVASAVIGASRPEQVAQNAVAAEVELSRDVLDALDVELGAVAITDPERTEAFTPKARAL